jgi:hypothetical protein
MQAKIFNFKNNSRDWIELQLQWIVNWVESILQYELTTSRFLSKYTHKIT